MTESHPEILTGNHDIYDHLGVTALHEEVDLSADLYNDADVDLSMDLYNDADVDLSADLDIPEDVDLSADLDDDFVPFDTQKPSTKTVLPPSETGGLF